VRRQGLFGTIEVRDSDGSRELLINDQRQGGSYLFPDASSVSDRSGPGPVSSSPYHYGWLIAGVMNPTGSGLMTGLGSGAGAVQLLANFSGVDLTVVEIDPNVVQLALKAYPLIGHYINLGQLNIVIDDAGSYLSRRYDKWDFGLVDTYDGADALIDKSLPKVADRCEHLYINAIDRFNGPSISKITAIMAVLEKPIVEVFKITTPEAVAFYEDRSNWILTTEEPDWVKLSKFEPFRDIDHQNADRARFMWDYLLSSSISEVNPLLQN